MTTAIGPMSTTISSTACSSSKRARIRTTRITAPRRAATAHHRLGAVARRRRAATQRVGRANLQRSRQGHHVMAVPQIEQAVRPNAEQRKLLDDVKRAAAEAAETFKASCGTNFPLTPPGRLAAMTSRLDATLQAVRTFVPRSRRSTIHCRTSRRRASPRSARTISAADRATRCAFGSAAGCESLQRRKAGPDRSADRADRGRSPADRAQQAALDRLEGATPRPWDDSIACPDVVPLTPVGRLEAMEKRLRRWCRPARPCSPRWKQFYASLSNEQKAHFNTLGQQAARQ